MELFYGLSDFISYSFLVIIAVLFSSIVIWEILKALLGGKLHGLSPIIIVLAIPGVVLHETAHYLFCIASGVEVKDSKLYTFRTSGVLGYVAHEQVDSFIASIFISLGPIILNGFVVSLILYFLPNLHEGIKYYLVFALVLGAEPSTTDLRNMFSPFNVDRNRSCFELFAIFISFIPAWFIATWNVYSVYEINWFLFEISYFISLVFLVGCYAARQI